MPPKRRIETDDWQMTCAECGVSCDTSSRDLCDHVSTDATVPHADPHAAAAAAAAVTSATVTAQASAVVIVVPLHPSSTATKPYAAMSWDEINVEASRVRALALDQLPRNIKKTTTASRWLMEDVIDALHLAGMERDMIRIAGSWLTYLVSTIDERCDLAPFPHGEFDDMRLRRRHPADRSVNLIATTELRRLESFASTHIQWHNSVYTTTRDVLLHKQLDHWLPHDLSAIVMFYEADFAIARPSEQQATKRQRV